MIGTSTSTKVKISNILDSQILDFIHEESPDFKDFLNQYYISEEREFGSTYISDNLTSLKNISDTSNNILNVSVPNILAADPSRSYDSSINAFDDEIPVTTTDGYPDQYGLFKIDNEIITYTGKTPTSFTGCIRGLSAISSIEKSEYLTFSETDSNEHFTNLQINVDSDGNPIIEEYKVTVESKDETHPYWKVGSNNGYLLNGNQSPSLTLLPGRTYKFNQSDISNSAHPIRFYLEANKTTSYGSKIIGGEEKPANEVIYYADGIKDKVDEYYNSFSTASVRYIQITVDYGTPTVLHYMCTNHGYMGNAAQINQNGGRPVLNLSGIFINEFYRKHKSQFLPGFEGREFVDQVNIENILTRAKDFYRSKGTDTSLEILFKVLFGKSVVIEKPFENTIGSSDSEWVVTDNMIVDVIEGDPFKLISTKIFQGTFDNPTADGTISNIQEVFLGSKKYYKLSFDKSAHFGSFNIGTKTKITEKAPDGSSTINVDSTVGFGTAGTFIYKYLDEFLVASYTSKSENQFFGCTGIVDEGIAENSDIIDDTFIFGYENGDPEKVCTMRITGTISKPSENVSNSKYASVGESIRVNYLGEKATGPKFDTWLYNHSTVLDIEGVFEDTDKTNIITTKEPLTNFLYQGCKVDIIRYDWAGGTNDDSLRYVPTSVSILTEGVGYSTATDVPTKYESTQTGIGTNLTVGITTAEGSGGAINGVTIIDTGIDYKKDELIEIIGVGVTPAIIKIDDVAPIGFGKTKPNDPGFGAFTIVDTDVEIDVINPENGRITLKKGGKQDFVDKIRPHQIRKKLAYADSSLDELSPNLLTNIQNTYIDDVGNTYVTFSGYPSYPLESTNRSVKVSNFADNEVFIADTNHSFLNGEKIFFEQNPLTVTTVTTKTETTDADGTIETETNVSISTSFGLGITNSLGNSVGSGEYYTSIVGINSFRLAITLEELRSGNFLKFNPPTTGISTVVEQTAADGLTIMANDSTNFSYLTRTSIVPSGSGSGSSGGFDMGGPYLHFAGFSGTRWAVLNKLDARNFEKIKVYAKVGNDSNGGEDPESSNEVLQLDYGIEGDLFSNFAVIGTIIPILSKNESAPNYNDGSLKVFELDIPDEAKKENVFFRLIQRSNDGSNYDHYGIQKIEITGSTAGVTTTTTTSVSGITTCIITPNDLANNILSNQNQFKRILKTPEIRESEDKIIGPIGVQLNGVELYSPVLEDFVCYGQIDDVVVTNKGENYDVVNPPNVSIASTNGSGAKLYGHFSGNISEIVVTHPGFNYVDTPQVSVTGGNIDASGKALVGEAYMRGFIHSFSFNDISNLVTNIDLDKDSVIHGEDKPHKFENGEEVVYTATGTPIGIGSTAVGFDTSRLTSGSTYFIRKNSEASFSLTVTKSDALSGINTIDFNEFGTGTHTLRSKKIRKIIDRISLPETGVKYQNRKVVVDSNIYPPEDPKNNLTTFTGINKYDNYIFAKNHGFSDGDIVEYNFDGTIISGLSTESIYKISVIDNNKFKLSDAGTATTITNSNYNQKIYVDLNNIGVGTHTFRYQDIVVNIKGNVSAGLVTSTLPSYYNATAYPIIDGSLDNVFVQNGGSGYGTTDITNYNTAPTLALEGGQDAELSPVINNGKIVNVSINIEGTGYSSPPILNVVGTGTTFGKFAKLKANVSSVGVNSITSVDIIDGGKDYISGKTSINVVPRGVDAKLKANVHKWNINARQRYSSVLGNDIFKDTTQVNAEVKLQNKIVAFYAGVEYRKSLNDNIDEDKKEITPPSKHSPILGWAYDGNPIYGPYGYADPVAGIGVTQLFSSYQLNKIEDKSLRPDFVDGYFIEDYLYIGDRELDQFNGRYGQTPEFPNGTYAYFTTETKTSSQFPYTTFIHRNKTDEVNYDIDYKQTDKFIDSGLYKRNVSPLGLNEKFRNYLPLSESLETDPELEVTACLPGKINQITTFESGRDYKVGDTINLNDSFVDASVGEILGKEIKKVEEVETNINNLNFSVKDNVITASGDSIHNFSNNDVVEISGITSSSYFGIQGLQKIEVNTTSTFVSVAIADTTSTGISTSIKLDVSTNSGKFKVNDVIQIDNEKMLIIGLDKLNDKYVVSRMHDSSVGGTHNIDSTVNKLEKSFTYKVSGKEIKDTNVNEEKIAYVNVTNSIGIGTTYTSVVVGTAGSSNITKSIPPRAIYIPNHNFKNGDKVSLVSIGGTIIASKNDSLTPDFNLSTINPLYCVKISNNYIGLSTEKVGFLTSYVYYKSVQDNDFFGKEVQIKTNENKLIGSAKRVNGLVTLGTSHSISVDETIRLNISPNRTEKIKFKFDANLRNLIVNSKTFENTGIGTTLSTITIPNHEFKTGDAVLYNVSTGSPINGLSDNKIYYAIRISENIIKLSETYKKATKKRFESINITGIGSDGILSKVNPKIHITKGNTLEIDTSDSSLKIDGTPLRINFYSDINFTDKISSNYIQQNGEIGDGSTDSKIIIRTDDISLERFYYRVENDNLLDNFANTDIQNHSTIDIIESKFNRLQTVTGVGNTTITFNSKVGSAETTTYSSYLSSGFSTATYSTNAVNDQGPITSVKIINFGKNTNVIPSVTSVGTTTGINAVFSVLSNDIAKIEDTDVTVQGWEFSKNKSLKPKADTYAILDLKNTLTLKSIGVSTGGRNYTTPPKVIGVGNTVITTRSRIDGNSVSGVDIISNDSGLQEDLRIIPTFNSNGINIVNATSASKNLTLELKAPIGGQFTDGLPFAVGDKIFVENVQIKTVPGLGTTDLASYNSSDYDYRFFEIIAVSNGSASANPSVTYSISGISTTEAGNFDGNFIFGRVTKAEDLASFEPEFQSVEYVKGEVISIGNGKATAIVSENGWDPQSKTLKVTDIVGKIDNGDEIIGSVNSQKAIIGNFNTYEFDLDVDVFAESLGFWKSDKNKPNFSYERLHDNDYYQRFSYALRGQVDYETWKEPVNSLGHISGYKNFADYEIVSNTFVGVSTIPKSDVEFRVEILSDASVHEQFDYDFVSEEETLSNIISREVQFDQKKLTDYIEAKTNKVLLLDDISNQFTGLSTITGQLVGLKNFTIKSSGNDIMHQVFDPTSLTVGGNTISIVDHGFTDGEELEYAPNSGGSSIGIVTTSAPGIAETSILPSKVFVNVSDANNFSLIIKSSESASGSAVTFSNVSGIGNQHTLSVNSREASIRSLITIDNVIQSPLGKKSTVLGLSTSVGIGSTEIFLNDISKVSGNKLLKINDEIMFTGLVGIGSTNSVSVVRGYMGTVAAAHTVGAGVSELYGDYRISKGNIYFSDAPYGPTGIGTIAGSKIEGGAVVNIPNAMTTRSAFTGRVFFRKNDVAEGRPGSMNRVVDDISDNFDGTTKLFDMKENSAVLPVGITTYGGALLINNIFQKPFFGDVGSVRESDYRVQSPVGGGTTIQFLANPDIASDTTDIPRGGRINEFLVGVGSGYQVPTRALAYANIGVGGTIESVSISTHGQGYISAPRVAIGVSYANYVHKFIRSLANSINPNVGSNKTPTFAEYDSFTGDLLLVIPNHGLTTTNTIQIVDNSLFFTCSRDGYVKEKSYPRSTDPASGKNLTITNATTNTIIVNVGAGAGVGAAFTSVVSAAGTITAINVVNPGTGYTATKDEPFIIIDEPTPYKNIPLLGGNGSGAKMDVVVGTGGSVIDFNIVDRGTGYEIGDNLVLHGLPVQVGVSTIPFNITVKSRYQDKFSGFTFGELIELDDFSSFFNGFRRSFLLTRTITNKEYFSIVAADGSGIVLANNLLVFVNDILQKPGVDYEFEGGTRFKFTEAPKAGSKFKIYFYKGSGTDVEFVDVDETIKPGDILTLDAFDQDKNNINEFPTQDPRVIYELTSATVVETQTYTGPGISSDPDYLRPVRWKKQTVDKIIDGEKIQKNRNLNTSQQYPATNIIASINPTDTVFSVKDIVSFSGIDNLSETQNSIKIIDQKETQVAIATATVDSATEKVSTLTLINAGFGYTTAPMVAIQPPNDVGTGVTATGGATIDGNGVVTGIAITNPGDGYTFNPQLVIEQPNIQYDEKHSNISFNGDRGIIIGIGTTNQGSNSGVSTDSPALIFDIIPTKQLPGAPSTKSGIVTGQYIVIQGTSFGDGIVSIGTHTSKIVSVGNSFADNVYQVGHYQDVGTGSTVRRITCNINTALSGINTNTGVTTNRFIGNYSWGTITVAGSRNGKSFEFYNQNGLLGIETSAHISRSLQLKQVY